MVKKLNTIFLVLACLFITACGSDDDQAKGEHVWKEQTDTIDKAKEVEGMLMGADAARREKLE